MAEFSENRHISNLINMSCKVEISFGVFTSRDQTVKYLLENEKNEYKVPDLCLHSSCMRSAFLWD